MMDGVSMNSLVDGVDPAGTVQGGPLERRASPAGRN